MSYCYKILDDGTMMPYPIDTQLPKISGMPFTITKRFDITNEELKNIIIKYIHQEYCLSGIFDINFVIKNIDGESNLVKTIIEINENENIQEKNR